MIVIDVGCARYGGDYSAERLIDWYHPAEYHGFDPNGDGLAAAVSSVPPRGGLVLNWYQVAAWTYDGEVRFMADGLNSQVGDNENWQRVPCIDLARFVEALPEGPVVLKLDAEGGEFEILEHLIETGTYARLSRILVEWHPIGQGKRRRAIESRLRGEVVVEQWRW